MDSLYEDPLDVEQVRRGLDALKQTGSACTFAAEFKTLAAILVKVRRRIDKLLGQDVAAIYQQVNHIAHVITCSFSPGPKTLDS
jgi:hypothetical protein